MASVIRGDRALLSHTGGQRCGSVNVGLVAFTQPRLAARQCPPDPSAASSTPLHRICCMGRCFLHMHTLLCPDGAYICTRSCEHGSWDEQLQAGRTWRAVRMPFRWWFSFSRRCFSLFTTPTWSAAAWHCCSRLSFLSCSCLICASSSCSCSCFRLRERRADSRLLNILHDPRECVLRVTMHRLGG